MRQVFLDTETTGLKVAEGDRLIEIGCIELVDRRPTGRRLHHYVNPQRSSHPDAVRAADKPLFEAVARELLDFVREADVVIHNAAFDLGFIDAELERLGLPRLAEHAGAITDSLALARELFPGKQNSLDALCKRLEVDNSQRELHGALLDAGLLAEVYLRMTRGQKSLVIEAEEVAGSIGAESVVDLSAFELVVLCASEEEAAAHEAVLADIDQASKGRTVWRPAPAAPVLA